LSVAADAGRGQAARESVYVVEGDAQREAITSSLQALLRTRHHPITRQRFTVLDTFDRRVRRAGARLTRSGTGGLSIVAWRPRDGRPPLTARLTEPVSFAWDLPDGPLQDALEAVIGVRRLLPQADAEEHGSALDILDDRRKTVARLRIQSGQVRQAAAQGAWRPLPTILTLTGLRGYDDDYERLEPIIASRPGVSARPDGLEGVILQHAGVPDTGGGPSLRIDLASDVRADAGAREIHRAIALVLTANEPGLRANIDTEFLHDFRVALRRTRSLLRQLRHVFPSDRVEHFSTEFAWLGRLTGPPRDLDVLALSLRAHGADLSAADLDALVSLLSGEQARERETLIEGMDSPRYERLLADWRQFLTQPAGFATGAPDARRPLVEVVAGRAWRLSKRLALSAEAISEHSDPSVLHEVRINAKKLRYLIDVTSSFYDPDDLECVLTALKKLQRVLGDFNDARVQETRLVELGQAIGAAGRPASAVLALGRLAERSRQRGDRLYPEAADELQQFRARATRAACRRAFKHRMNEERAR
jgi:CHAD domain-containing protein